MQVEQSLAPQIVVSETGPGGNLPGSSTDAPRDLRKRAAPEASEDVEMGSEEHLSTEASKHGRLAKLEFEPSAPVTEELVYDENIDLSLEIAGRGKTEWVNLMDEDEYYMAFWDYWLQVKYML